MRKVNLDEGNAIGFVFKGKEYEVDMPSLRRFRDNILPFTQELQKVENVDDGAVTKEQMDKVIKLFHVMVPAFSEEDVGNMSPYQMRLVQEAITDRLPGKKAGTPGVGKNSTTG